MRDILNSGELVAKLIKREYNQERTGADRCLDIGDDGELSLPPRKFDYSQDQLFVVFDNGVRETWKWIASESKFIRKGIQ